MQRLALALILAVLAIAAVAAVARAVRTVRASDRTLALVDRSGDGAMQRLAFILLMGLIAYVAFLGGS